jgi:hypothetical protein
LGRDFVEVPPQRHRHRLHRAGLALAEPLHRVLQRPCLDVELFHTLAEAKVILADWIVAYNTEHPHSALGMLPPARFAARWWEENAAPTPPSSRPTGSLREASPVDATVPTNTSP